MKASGTRNHTALLNQHLEVGVPGGRCGGLRRPWHTRIPLVAGSLGPSRPGSCQGEVSPYWLLPLALPLCVWFDPHLRARGARTRYRSGHHRCPPAVRPGQLAGGSGQAAGHRHHPGLRGISRKEGPAAQIGASLDEPLFGSAPARRRGPSPVGDLRHQRRICLCLWHADLGGASSGSRCCTWAALITRCSSPVYWRELVGHLVCGVRALPCSSGHIRKHRANENGTRYLIRWGGIRADRTDAHRIHARDWKSSFVPSRASLPRRASRGFVPRGALWGGW